MGFGIVGRVIVTSAFASRFLSLGRVVARAKMSVKWREMTVRPYWAQILAFIVAVIASYVALFHADQPLLEREAFRQTQTALTSYWMIKEGWQLAYQTPMLGYPWTIPLEFPFYQSIVAFITLTTGFSLDAVGRLVSFGFSLACAWPAFAIARRLKLTSTVAWIFCALLWSSPQYLYWGRTFLMETAAVFFTLAAVPYALDLRDHSPKWSSVLLFGMFASLGLLQKGTTAAPVLLVLGLLICITHLRKKPAIWHRRWVPVAIALVLPIIVGGLWTYYAARIRRDNFFAASAFVPAVYVGRLDLRFNLSVWKTIVLDRVIINNAAWGLGVSIIFCALIIGENRLKAIILVCIILLFLPILLFMNSHYWLDYYQTAIVVFLIAALALSIYVFQIKIYPIAPITAVVLVVANFANFMTGYGRYGRLLQGDLSEKRALSVGNVIRRYTPEDSAIAVFELATVDDPMPPITSYSPEIIYYSHRKGLTVEEGRARNMSDDLLRYLGGKDLGAIVICKPNLENFLRFVPRYDNSSVIFFEIDSCYVWLPRVSSVILENGRPADRITVTSDRKL